jgi:hypothetical protein
LRFSPLERLDPVSRLGLTGVVLIASPPIVTIAIQSEFGEDVLHRTDAYLNNVVEPDRRGIKGRY